MIAKYVDPLNILLSAPCFLYDLSYGTIMVQSAETSYILFLYCGGEMAQNIGISIGWISYNHAFDFRLGSRKSFCLLHKYFLIDL